MNIVALYDFNGGKKIVQENFPEEWAEIQSVISNINALDFKTKQSREKTMHGKFLFSPTELNQAFKAGFQPLGWQNYSIECDYQYGEYLAGYRKSQARASSKPFRDMDFIKTGKKLGVEVQFGKYAFMVYNVCAKMTIFKKQGVIDAGVEIVPVKCFADEMSTGVSYFEQFAWDLTHRGTSNIDIPVLIVGIDI